MAVRRPEPLHIPPLTCDPEREPSLRDPTRWWWRGHYTVDGKTRHITLGRGTSAEIAGKAAALIAAGLPATPRPKPPPQTVVVTVRDAVEYWLGHQKKRAAAEQIAERSMLAYRASARRLVNEKSPHQIGDLALEDLTDHHLEQYALARVADGNAAITVNDDCGVLVMALKWGRKTKLHTAEVSYERLRGPRKRPTRTPTRDEIVALIRAMPGRYGLAMWIQYATGARIGEVAAIEWADLDLEAGTVTLGIHPGASKTGPRTVPLPAEMVTTLVEWRDRPPERPPRGAPVDDETRARWVLGARPVTVVSKVIKLLPAACRAVAAELHLDAEASRITSHAIRRWCVDELGRVEVDPGTAGSQLGHSPAEMWDSYRRPGIDERRAAVTRAGLGVIQGGRAS